jgi:hypothetical protein
MALTSSYIVEHAQKDGRKWVREKHIDAFDREHFRYYLSTDAMDRDAILAASAINIEEILKAGDFQKCLEFDTVSTEYASTAEIAAYVRERYKNGAPEEVVRIARWIRRRIASGQFTETQVRNVFGLTVTQWNNLFAKMAILESALDTVEEAEGE